VFTPDFPLRAPIDLAPTDLAFANRHIFPPFRSWDASTLPSKGSDHPPLLIALRPPSPYNDKPRPPWQDADRSNLSSKLNDWRMPASEKCLSMAQGDPERSMSTKEGLGPCCPPGPLRSAPIHTFGNFTQNVDQGGPGWTRRTRGTITPLGGPEAVFTFC